MNSNTKNTMVQEINTQTVDNSITLSQFEELFQSKICSVSISEDGTIAGRMEFCTLCFEHDPLGNIYSIAFVNKFSEIEVTSIEEILDITLDSDGIVQIEFYSGSLSTIEIIEVPKEVLEQTTEI